MRIENEMLSRFGNLEEQSMNNFEMSLSQELDFFFDNVYSVFCGAVLIVGYVVIGTKSNGFVTTAFCA